MLLVLRPQMPHRATHDGLQPGLPLEGRIDLEKDIVAGLASVVEDNLDDAEARINRIEELAILRLAFAQRRLARQVLSFHRLQLSGIANCQHDKIEMIEVPPVEQHDPGTDRLKRVTYLVVVKALLVRQDFFE